MYMQRLIFFSVLSGVLIVFALCIPATQAQEHNAMRFTGSKYMYFNITDLAKYYFEGHPNFKVQVDCGENYSLIPAMVEKAVDAVMALGKLDDDMKLEASEQGIQLQEQLVGWGAVVLVTDPHNPVNELSLEQIRKIFLGEYKNWNEVGGLDEPIVTMSRDESVSGTEKFFREFVLDGQPMGQQTVRLFDPDIARAVRKLKGSMADARYTEAVRGKIRGLVKIIAVKQDEESTAIMPSVDSLRTQSYPMSAPMYLYYDAKSATRGLNDFVLFCAHRGVGDHYEVVKKITSGKGASAFR
jgi:phosphate transport system substrate-binding protein